MFTPAQHDVCRLNYVPLSGHHIRVEVRVLHILNSGVILLPPLASLLLVVDLPSYSALKASSILRRWLRLTIVIAYGSINPSGLKHALAATFFEVPSDFFSSALPLGFRFRFFDPDSFKHVLRRLAATNLEGSLL